MDSWPNQEALNKALNYYRSSMRTFIISHLSKIPDVDVEEEVLYSLREARQTERYNAIERILNTSERDIKSIIDINDFPHLIQVNWTETFRIPLSDDKSIRNQLWLIKDGRDQSWAHPPEGDADSEGTRAYLFLIADVLGKINNLAAKTNVEKIRDELFYDDTKDRLEEAEERIRKLELENNDYNEKHKELSQKMIDNAIKIEDKSKQLRESLKENNEYKNKLDRKTEEFDEAQSTIEDYKK